MEKMSKTTEKMPFFVKCTTNLFFNLPQKMKKALNDYLLDLASFETLQNVFIEKYSDQLKKAPERLEVFIDCIFKIKQNLEEYELENGYKARLQKQKAIIEKLGRN